MILYICLIVMVVVNLTLIVLLRSIINLQDKVIKSQSNMLDDITKLFETDTTIFNMITELSKAFNRKDTDNLNVFNDIYCNQLQFKEALLKLNERLGDY